MLALVVTTSAQRAMHKPTPAVLVEVATASMDAGRTGLPTETVLDSDILLVTRPSRFPGAPDGAGGGSGGIAAGGFPGTSQFFGFEPGEGFAPGVIDGQAGWVTLVNQPNDIESAFEAHIDIDNPATGIQQLQVGHDPALGTDSFVGGLSPNMGSFENTSAVVSVEVFITGSGRSYNVRPQSTQVIVADVRFNRVGNRIEVLDDIDGDGGFVYEITGVSWIPDQYVNLTINLSALGAVTVSYNGVLIYTVIDTTFGTSVQNVVLRGNNGFNKQVGHADFDNLDVAGGVPPTGACCNSDGMSGCEFLNAIDCAAAGGLYLGNDTLCVDCPLGACCNIDGMDGCEITDPAVCAAIMDAFYLGDDTPCTSCPVVPDTCGSGAGDCLVAHVGPGCDDIECCALVCDQLPFCCIPGFDWDADCAAAALDTFCAPAPACGVPGTGDCFTATPQGADDPFCDDNCGIEGACAGCCALICALDPFCCNMLPGFAGTWDAQCVIEAEELCGCAVEDVPANNDCINAIEVFVGPAIDVSTECGSPDGLSHDTCNDGFSTGLGVDVWFIYNATFDGALTVTPTALDPAVWLTQLSVYEGADCGALSDPPLACAELGGAAIVDPVINGTSYLIRLGASYLGPIGTGTLELEAVPGACIAAVTDCLTAVGTAGCSDLSCCAVVCQALPACCDVAWDQACADAAALDCAPFPCGPLDLTPANLQENEVCGTDINGGCNSAPPVFTPVVSGTVVHGTAWAEGGRDTDWYSLTIDPLVDANGNGMVSVTYDVVSELPIVSFFIVDADPICQDGMQDTSLGTVAYSQSCVQKFSGLATVPIVGNYYVFAGTGTETGGLITEGYPCPIGEGPVTFGNNYLLTINVIDDALQCPWDCQAVPNQDVGINDFLDLLGQWSQVGTSCDLGEGPDGVGVEDFLALLGHWGPCP